jgi:uncharacterized membrane protein YiaA
VPDRETVELAVMILVAFGLVLLVLERLFRRRAPRDAIERRQWHASAARSSTSVALVCVGLLVLAVLLGRLLLGAMALVGIVVFTALAIVRGRLSR